MGCGGWGFEGVEVLEFGLAGLGLGHGMRYSYNDQDVSGLCRALVKVSPLLPHVPTAWCPFHCEQRKGPFRV